MATSQQIRRHMESLLGTAFTEGNDVTRLRNGDEIFPAMLEAIDSARDQIDFLTFIYWDGGIAERFAAALAARAREGVRVRVLLDAFGAKAMPEELHELMEAAGVDLRWFRPLATWRVWRTTHRTHRKVLVVDGRIGFTGGVGIASEWEGDARYEGEWRDDHFRLRGPAVRGLQAAFLGNWVETGAPIDDEPSPSLARHGDASVVVVQSVAAHGWSDVATMLDGLLSSAGTRLRIATAYFAPDADLTDRLCGLTREGVSVEVLIPGPHIDRRLSELSATDQLAPLIEAGVRVFAFQPSMLHLKVITVDGNAACIGSPNINQRSARQDDEVALIVLDDELVRLLDEDFDEDLARSEPVTVSDLESRGIVRRAKEALVRPFRPHL